MRNARVLIAPCLALSAGCGKTSKPLSAIKAADVTAVEVTLVRYDFEARQETTTTFRSADRTVIDGLFSVLTQRQETTDCKCPYYGYMRLLGPSLDVRVQILPGHSTKYYDFYDTDRTRWKVPRAPFIEALERLGVKDVPR